MDVVVDGEVVAEVTEVLDVVDADVEITVSD